VPVGEWVLEQACRQLVTWQAQEPRPVPLTMSVNVSGVQMARPDFVERVADLLERTGVDRGSLSLEITETVLMRDAEQALGVLRSLKELGVGVSVDDFGTGYSSLTYLKRFPVDILKIDRSFVDGLGSDPDDLAIVQTTVALAASLGMTSVAEGIETAAHLAVLKQVGCDHGQGYLFSRPCPAEGLTALLRTGFGDTIPAPRASTSSRAESAG
jgi:EAL domain-containing protein (putative c-di-GMP-specific phosphodiesterase class I)